MVVRFSGFTLRPEATRQGLIEIDTPLDELEFGGEQAAAQLLAVRQRREDVDAVSDAVEVFGLELSVGA